MSETLASLASLALAVLGCVALLLGVSLRLHVWRTGRWQASLRADGDRDGTLRRLLYLRRLLEFCGLQKTVDLCLLVPTQRCEDWQNACNEAFGQGLVTVVPLSRADE